MLFIFKVVFEVESRSRPESRAMPIEALHHIPTVCSIKYGVKMTSHWAQ